MLSFLANRQKPTKKSLFFNFEPLYLGQFSFLLKVKYTVVFLSSRSTKWYIESVFWINTQKVGKMPILTIFGQIFYKIFIIHSDCLLDIPTEEAIGYQMSIRTYLQHFSLHRFRRSKIGYFYKLSIYSILPVVCYGRPTMAGLSKIELYLN